MNLLKDKFSEEPDSSAENRRITPAPLPVQRKFYDDGPVGQSNRFSSSKSGIPLQMRRSMEASSGVSLEAVRIHYHSDKPAQLQSLAYTQGENVYIAPGQEKHLMHELGHVVQQKKGIVQPTHYEKGVPINDDPALEQAADAWTNRCHE